MRASQQIAVPSANELPAPSVTAVPSLNSASESGRTGCSGTSRCERSQLDNPRQDVSIARSLEGLLALFRWALPQVVTFLDPSHVVTTEEAALILGVTSRHVRRKVREGKLPAMKCKCCGRYGLALDHVLNARFGQAASGHAPKGGAR